MKMFKVWQLRVLNEGSSAGVNMVDLKQAFNLTSEES